MTLRVYNYLSRQEETFEPLHPGFVGMYVCGPTVYGDAHIGHAKAYITFDVVHRYLEYLGYRVRYVQNITDVGHLVGDGDEGEDKIGRQARVERVEPMEIVESYTRNYFRDMDVLNVRRPDISPRASGHVPEQIELAQELLTKGHAYASNGNVYFSVPSWPTYGKLSRRKVDDLEEGARLEVAGDKRDPRDFAVWRAATSGHLMQWNSPWGKGFPGWHAECTVMARKYLGLPFDIHGGGLENIFPHNESEIAQSEAAYGGAFARYWLLNNMVTIDGTKMGKSQGNSLTVQQALTGKHDRLSQPYSPMTVRYFILSSHYRQTTDFTDEALSAAARGYERLLGTVGLVRQMLAKQDSHNSTIDAQFSATLVDLKTRFEEAMNNDFNTPQALAALFDFNRAVNTLVNSQQPVSSGTLEAIDNTYRQLGGDVLGIIPAEISTQGAGAAGLEDELVQILITLRTAARKNKDYATSDAIRDQLAAAGVILEDRPDGTVWKINR
ncbi:MAG: cysteine--tRNA ligase [Anaerolineaceae bacterium]|nr:cysteine--tRNA ligase [Anaerolineaceae bacterium]MCB9101813.1 cysteine--tRNA ligase [Anaerolineales bacterium]